MSRTATVACKIPQVEYSARIAALSCAPNKYVYLLLLCFFIMQTTRTYSGKSINCLGVDGSDASTSQKATQFKDYRSGSRHTRDHLCKCHKRPVLRSKREETFTIFFQTDSCTALCSM